MDEETFWRIVDCFDWDRTGDDEAVVEPAVAALAAMPVEEIRGFQEIMAAKLYALDTEAHARNMGEYAYEGPGKGFSVDQFLYARCVVVANGRALFNAVVANPGQMPKDMDFESLLYVAEWAHQRKTEGPLDRETTVSYETFSNRTGWGVREA